MSTALELPRWDMTVVYPSLESPEFQEDFHSIIQELDDLARYFDECHIEKQDEVPIDQATVRTFETSIHRFSALLERIMTLYSYIYSFVTTDSRDNLAQAQLSELQQHMVRLAQLETRATAWVGSMDVEALIRSSSVASDYAYLLRRTKTEAEHQMSPAEEALAVELNLTGGSAWSKLHGNLTSQLTVPIERDGEVQRVPMSVARNMAYDPDRAVRRCAYEAELDVWAQVAVPIAAALNSIKGQTNTLDSRREWESALDLALFQNDIDRQALEAMLEGARASFPDFRRYLRAKARALGLPKLAWYDLFAPVGQSEQTWEFGPATAFLLDQFGRYSPRLREFGERAFRERWIDAEPRPGKRDGAFCMPLRGDESRVLANYRPTYEGMSTLAHELGHAYHNLNLARRPYLQRNTPMTLAETASIFCETIVREAALQHADQQEQVSILESSLENSCQIVVDIFSRFTFEKAVFEARHRRELAVDEFKELMLEAQRETYGDGLDQTQLHPYMWAVKGHYYSAGNPFYNFPYMFGLLFGLGLYARYRDDPEGFKAGYDELLSSTGMADAATLAGRFGIDLHRPEFWESSLDIVRADIDRFETLISSS
jgi:pepF/M3 family oligoendopeptidase